MHLSISEPEIVIAWGRRSLYVLLFIILAFARWDQPFTFGYVGAIVIFCIMGLSLTKEESAQGDMNNEDISA
jgi:hypothetical protein